MYLINMSGRTVVPFVNKVEIVKCETEGNYVIKCGDIDMVCSSYMNIHRVMERFIRACDRGANVFDFGRALGQIVLEQEDES